MKSNKKDQVAVDKWNKNVKVGDAVNVRKDDGSIVPTKTTAEAQLLGGHTPVVWVEAISGAYLLERVKPI